MSPETWIMSCVEPFHVFIFPLFCHALRTSTQLLPVVWVNVATVFCEMFFFTSPDLCVRDWIMTTFSCFSWNTIYINIIYKYIYFFFIYFLFFSNVDIVIIISRDTRGRHRPIWWGLLFSLFSALGMIQTSTKQTSFVVEYVSTIDHFKNYTHKHGYALFCPPEYLLPFVSLL